ncbi:MAG: diguanylate cyclase [Desulfurivibrionaceae bacterium]|jgi:diguanylate cyclase (GGDEF)-like protein
MDAKVDQYILVVEDDKFFAKLLRERLVDELGYAVIWTSSLAETVDQLNNQGDKQIVAGILDYHLPDAHDGEIITTVIDYEIPVIVFTGLVDESVREKIWNNEVADYVVKGQPNSIDYVISMVRRIAQNSERQVLVVDDSMLFLNVLTNWLKIHRYQVVAAKCGKEALELLQEYPGIKLAIIDYVMPEMNGVELIYKIRESYKKEDMAIIGISGVDNNVMAANFLKCGANDFLVKEAIIPEEFYCRVNQCLENNENIHAIREAAIKDFLTGLYNRRYFFEVGQKLFANAERQGSAIACAIIDIDYFKKVNDRYGHEAGDLALKSVAKILGSRTRYSDLIARLGGEEFSILALNMNTDDVLALFDLLRKTVEETPVDIGGGQKIPVTISIGVCLSLQGSLEKMMGCADAKLYEAKKGGRNRIIVG